MILAALRFFTARGFSAAGAKVALMIFGTIAALLLLSLGKCAYDARVTAKAKTERAQATATAEAAGSATETVAAGAARDVEINTAVQKGTADVLATPGAAAPIDPGTDAAGRAALCKLPSYRLTVACRGLRGDGAAAVANPDPAR